MSEKNVKMEKEDGMILSLPDMDKISVKMRRDQSNGNNIIISEDQEEQES